MADTTSFPQIPSTVWVGVWKILHDSPSRRIDENVLAIELSVQKTAAKAYLNELVRLGLFSADGSATDLAKRWRQDGDDSSVIEEILKHAYPQELLELAPVDRLDRQKIERWFVSRGFGSGTAKNKAATYLRLAAGVSGSSGNSVKAERPLARTRTSTSRGRTAKPATPANHPQGDDNDAAGAGGSGGRRLGRPDIHVNIQIHISADSTSEQIDAIFSAMRRYFDGPIDSE